jgi:hypothetical protein
MAMAMLLVIVFAVSTAAAAAAVFGLRLVCALLPALVGHGGAVRTMAVVLVLVGFVVIATVTG